MSFLDRWHDVHHTGSVVDLINCPNCQDEYADWVIDRDGYAEPYDRIEELEGVA